MALATKALAKQRRCRELADRAAVLLELASAADQCCQELAKCAAAMAESALSAVQCCRESRNALRRRQSWHRLWNYVAKSGWNSLWLWQR
jgi:hypothetical protein